MVSNNVDILVPNLPESVTDATVAVWCKKKGDVIKEDEVLLELETDKIILEVPSPQTGILEDILEKEGSIVKSGQILGYLKCNDIHKNRSYTEKVPTDHHEHNISSPSVQKQIVDQYEDNNINALSPVIRKLITEHNLNIQDIIGSGIKGRLTRQDVEIYIKKQLLNKNEISSNIINNNICSQDLNNLNYSQNKKLRTDRRIEMSRLRKKISERLLNVIHSTAMLTTFNEVNMISIIQLRTKYKEFFEKKHGVKLGIMSFYVKSVLEGLKRFPEVNASIDGEEIVYHDYFDISIAVSTKRGLVTPVLRDVNKLSIVDIEKNIKFLAEKGRTGKLTIDELKGGNFTITNGGIFGSLMSTPIINPPQSAILGIHAIKERPMVVDGKIVILPMMYLALSYDHRLIDGKDSVCFLKTIKELIEDPMRLCLEL